MQHGGIHEQALKDKIRNRNCQRKQGKTINLNCNYKLILFYTKQTG